MKTLIHTSIAGTLRAICLISGIIVFLSATTAQNNLNYSFKKITPQAKTETIEDWESGTLTQLEWETGGTQPWLVSNLTPYEGAYCASSGDINDNQNSWISLTYDVYSPENISFWYRVESESGYDYLRFYIDNTEQGEWAGIVPWTQATFPVTAGNHTFKWEYSKDVSVSTGADAGFIDYIVFPPMEIEAFFTSDTTVICEGNAVMFYDQSVGPITSWSWIFEGGTPGTSSAQNPVVGYGADGSYDVLLEVTDGVETSQVYMANYITVGQIPAVCPAPTGITYLCASWGNSSYNTVGLTGITLYDWLVDPIEAGTVSGTGKNVTVIWAEDFLGIATLKVAGVNYCGVGVYSNPLTITRYLPTVDLPGFAAVSISTPPFTLTGGTPSGGTYSGPGVSNGIFSPAVAGLGNHTITYTYTDLNLCENFAEGMIFVSQFTDISGNNFTTGVNIQPNPSNGSFVVNMNLPETTSVDVNVFNSLSETVYSAKSIASDQKLTYNIDLSNYPAGIYYVHITSPDNQWIKKVIITK
jgi:PKD repeat protein